MVPKTQRDLAECVVSLDRIGRCGRGFGLRPCPGEALFVDHYRSPRNRPVGSGQRTEEPPDVLDQRDDPAPAAAVADVLVRIRQLGAGIDAADRREERVLARMDQDREPVAGVEQLEPRHRGRDPHAVAVALGDVLRPAGGGERIAPGEDAARVGGRGRPVVLAGTRRFGGGARQRDVLAVDRDSVGGGHAVVEHPIGPDGPRPRAPRLLAQALDMQFPAPACNRHVVLPPNRLRAV